MTRSEYIQAVNVKLEEISPFDNNNDNTPYLAISSPDSNEVKPIAEYIDATIDLAAEEMLNSLPVTLLAEDITRIEKSAPDGTTYKIEDNVGYLSLESVTNGYLRPVYLKVSVWQRPVTAFMTQNDPMYDLQCNPHTRGGIAKPVVAYITQPTPTLELYSIPTRQDPHNQYDTDTKSTKLVFQYIDPKIAVEDVQSPIEDYIVLSCATKVLTLMERADLAANFTQELQAKLSPILK